MTLPDCSALSPSLLSEVRISPRDTQWYALSPTFHVGADIGLTAPAIPAILSPHV
jgi:hypothetical protein